MRTILTITVFFLAISQMARSQAAGRQLSGVYTPASTPALPPEEAAKKMRDNNVSSLVVVDNKNNGNKPIGIVTERDLVRKVCVNDANSSKVLVKEIMSSPLIMISSRSSPSEAADMMLQHNVRHLLVVDNTSNNDVNTPVGIITPLDFTRYQENTAEEDKEAIEKVLENYISSPDADAFTGV